MKKIIALLLAVVMVACLFAGCQGGDGRRQPQHKFHDR